MRRIFESERSSAATSFDRSSFTFVAALPNLAVDDSRPDAYVDDVPTTALAEPPVRPLRSGAGHDRLDRQSRTLAIALPAARSPAIGAPRLAAHYRLSEPIGTGGMATVHLGVTSGSGRVHAIKRLHAHFADDEYFAQTFLDEAAISARIRHDNVVTMHGAGIVDGNVILVMDYVAGVTMADLIRTIHPRKLDVRMATAIIAGALRGLHAAHETFDERGRWLEIVHRDVSPHNIHLGVDGVARVLDFGIAKAEFRTRTTRIGELKGKIAYMAPEQVTGKRVDRRVDVRAAAVVLWEALVGGPLFHAENETATIARVLEGAAIPPSELAEGVPPELDAIVMRALSMDPHDRFATALEMAEALDGVFVDKPRSHEIAAWLNPIAADRLAEERNVRADLLSDISMPPPPRAIVTAAESVTTVAPIGAVVHAERHSPNAVRRPRRARLVLQAVGAILALLLAAGFLAVCVRMLSDSATLTAP